MCHVRDAPGPPRSRSLAANQLENIRSSEQDLVLGQCNQLHVLVFQPPFIPDADLLYLSISDAWTSENGCTIE